MTMPATSGKLCTSLSSMAIGDYIGVQSLCDIQAGIQFTDPVNYDLPVYGANATGNCYLIKVDKGLLICDRTILAWTGNNINTLGIATGIQCNMGTKIGNVFLRSPSYAEWDQYIVNSYLNGTIVKQDTKVWNTSNLTSISDASNACPQYAAYGTWLQDTLGATRRVAVSSTGDYSPAVSLIHMYLMWASLVHTMDVPCYLDPSKASTSFINYINGVSGCFNQINLYVGYRPVVEYIDNPKSTTVFM